MIGKEVKYTTLTLLPHRKFRIAPKCSTCREVISLPASCDSIIMECDYSLMPWKSHIPIKLYANISVTLTTQGKSVSNRSGPVST